LPSENRGKFDLQPYQNFVPIFHWMQAASIIGTEANALSSNPNLPACMWYIHRARWWGRLSYGSWT